MEQIVKEVLPDNFGRLEKFAQRNNGYLAVGRVCLTPSQKIEFFVMTFLVDLG
jgi:hypothetical protein